ncbi:lytic transglycosylase domain-containing protein [Neomicrococcus lactis]|uniref:lytic transglycosylase domain-containing protein n=1 Tax=Neomicrococcus lactis TaxID=732241 RepID=UPI0023015A22|nr:lytic transglycosylase domain-containing protein [Neomicrococcus lactis]
MSAVTSVKNPARQPLRLAIASGTTVSALVLATVGATGAMADDVVTVKRGDTISHIAAANNVSVPSVLKLNGLSGKDYIFPGQKLVVRGTSSVKPAASSTSSKSPSKATAAKPAKAAPARTYVVERGDTLSHIARHLGVTLKQLLAANNLKVSSVIRPGQKIVAPAGATVPAPSKSTPSKSTPSKSTTTKPSTPAKATSKVYTVVRGDSLDSIARRMNSQVDAIMEANNLSSTFLRVGQRLNVPTISASGGKQLVGGQFLGYSYSSSTVNSANRNKQILLARGVPSKAEMKALIIRTARQMGVEPQLALGHAMQESGLNHASVSPANAIGVMQVIPSSGAWASDLVGRKLDLLKPEDNVVAGIAIIRSLQRTMPSMQHGIGAYYQGAGSVKKNGFYSDTRSYVNKVLKYRAQFF